MLAKVRNIQGLRTIALVLLAPAYARIDARQAAEWVRSADQSLNSATDNSARLRLMTTIVEADSTMHCQDSARLHLAAALALGEEVTYLLPRQCPSAIPPQRTALVYQRRSPALQIRLSASYSASPQAPGLPLSQGAAIKKAGSLFPN